MVTGYYFIVAHSDGGTRPGCCSAATWIIEVGFLENGTWMYKMAAMGGKYMSPPVSSFLAESIALEECSLALKSVLENFDIPQPAGKQARVR